MTRNLPLDEEIFIEAADVDILKNTRSRLRVGTSLTREEMLRLALMSSENRAAASAGTELIQVAPALLSER